MRDKIFVVIFLCENHYRYRSLLLFTLIRSRSLSLSHKHTILLRKIENDVKQNDTKIEQLIRKNYFRIVFFPLAFTANIPSPPGTLGKAHPCVFPFGRNIFINIRIMKTVLRQYTHFIRFNTFFLFFNFTKIQLTR